MACGAAIALGNVLLPSIVTRDFAHRLGLTSGLCTSAICASAVLGAGLSCPALRAGGSWRAALAGWAAPAAPAVVLPVPTALRRRASGPPWR